MTDYQVATTIEAWGNGTSFKHRSYTLIKSSNILSTPGRVSKLTWKGNAEDGKDRGTQSVHRFPSLNFDSSSFKL